MNDEDDDGSVAAFVDSEVMQGDTGTNGNDHEDSVVDDTSCKVSWWNWVFDGIIYSWRQDIEEMTVKLEYCSMKSRSGKQLKSRWNLSLLINQAVAQDDNNKLMLKRVKLMIQYIYCIIRTGSQKWFYKW